MSDLRIKAIRDLEDQVRTLEDTAENRRRERLWIDKCDENDCNWHPLPRNKGIMPFSFEIERIGYSQMLNFDLILFYTDPIEFLLRSLQINVFKFQIFPSDCTPIAKSISYWPGVGFEASLMGMPQKYTNEDAWVGRDHLLKSRQPLDAIQYPDFESQCEMARIHEFYQRMRDILSDDFKIMFPQWTRSPWSVAWALRGIDNLIYDWIDDPEWTYSLLMQLSEFRIRFANDRAKFLGISPIKPTNFYNDEVTFPVVSPDMYRKLILPSEIKVSKAFGGINYWHSCGNTTPFYEDINKIPNLAMVHVSPWSDIWEANKKYSDDIVIEVALNPVTDVMNTPTIRHAENRLLEIKEATKERLSVCRADGFMVTSNVKSDIKKLQNWMDLANKILFD